MPLNEDKLLSAAKDILDNKAGNTLGLEDKSGLDSVAQDSGYDLSDNAVSGIVADPNVPDLTGSVPSPNGGDFSSLRASKRGRRINHHAGDDDEKEKAAEVAETAIEKTSPGFSPS